MCKSYSPFGAELLYPSKLMVVQFGIKYRKWYEIQLDWV